MRKYFISHLLRIIGGKDLHEITHGDFIISRFFQRLFRKSHASDGDLWNMDAHLARIILPKLSAFRAQNLQGYPEESGSMEAWLAILDEMIYAMQWKILEYQHDTTLFKYSSIPSTPEEAERAQKGFELFGKYFNHLWD
jgi:hypothetical protein